VTQPKHERIITLRDLNCYPGSEWLDMHIQLPWSEDPTRRLWLMIPKSSPTISFEDTTYAPQRVSSRLPRWIDYGVVELPIGPESYLSWSGSLQLRFLGMKVPECITAHLLIATDLALSVEGCSLEEAERRLWGLARCDAGSTTLQPTRLTASSPATFSVRYTTGRDGLPAGALVRFVVPKAFSMPQTDNSEAPGFTSIVKEDCQVSIVTIGPATDSHEKTDIICRLKSSLAPFEGFELQYNTDRTYIFPRTFHGSKRRFWYSHLPPLAADVALSDRSAFVSLKDTNGHTLGLVPGPSERLHLFLPGRRFDSEMLTLRGIFTDHYRNVPPSGPTDANLELWLVTAEERILLGAPSGRFVARHRFEITLPRLSPGIYRAVACRPSSRDEIARSNPMEIIPEHEQQDRLFWGEIHGHTEMSDGTGEFSELYRHARDEGCLEFAAASDHAEYFSDNQWLWMQDVTNSWNQPGRFVTLVGYEWGGQQKDRNVYTSRSRLKLFRGTHPRTRNLNVMWEQFHDDEEVVGGPHAPLVHKTVWEFHDPSVERFVEIYSMWGASDFRDSPLVPDWIEDGRGMTAIEILGKGAILGFTGGGDCHEGHAGFSSEDPNGQGTTPHTFAAILLYRCGMTAAVMPHLDRRSLVQAIRNRQTYATTGARILLHFAVSGLPMGSIGYADTAECCATVHAVEAIRMIEIIKDGKVVWSHQLNHLDATIRWQDPVPPTSEHYYYLHIVQADGQMAWSSPIWIRPSSRREGTTVTLHES